METAQLAEQVSCCTQDLSADEQHLQLTLLRLLAEGAPVAPERLAAHAALPDSEVRALLAGWHGVHRDEVGRVVAFRGLSVVESPHRLHVDRRELFAWCAWDTLLLPQLIGCPADVESICPTTGATVSLRVGADGPSEVSPADAVLSFIRPGPAFTEDAIASFCRFVHFFASPQAAEAWTQRHPGTFVISIEQGFELCRRCSPKRGGGNGHPQR
jgi:alkylmercury lyase